LRSISKRVKKGGLFPSPSPGGEKAHYGLEEKGEGGGEVRASLVVLDRGGKGKSRVYRQKKRTPFFLRDQGATWGGKGELEIAREEKKRGGGGGGSGTLQPADKGGKGRDGKKLNYDYLREEGGGVVHIFHSILVFGKKGERKEEKKGLGRGLKRGKGSVPPIALHSRKRGGYDQEEKEVKGKKGIPLLNPNVPRGGKKKEEESSQQFFKKEKGKKKGGLCPSMVIIEKRRKAVI